MPRVPHRVLSVGCGPETVPQPIHGLASSAAAGHLPSVLALDQGSSQSCLASLRHCGGSIPREGARVVQWRVRDKRL